MSEKALSTEECLAESGELFKNTQYQKCKQLLLEYHSSCRNYGDSEHVSHDDNFEAGSSRRNNLISSSSKVMKCVFEQNNYVCGFLEHLNEICNVDKALCQESLSFSSLQQDKTEGIYKKSCVEIISLPRSFMRLFQDMRGWTVSERHVGVELVLLNNFLAMHLNQRFIDVPEWQESDGFAMIDIVLRRAFETITGYVASGLLRPITERIICLLDGILFHTEDIKNPLLKTYSLSLPDDGTRGVQKVLAWCNDVGSCCGPTQRKDMTEFTLGAFSAVCYSIFFFLLSCKNFEAAPYMRNIMSKIEVSCRSRKQQKHTRQSFVCLWPSNLVPYAVPSRSDLAQLVLACICLAANEVRVAYINLERITYAGWEPFIGYVKAFLLFGEKQYDEALEISWTLWKARQTAENWMVSRLSNIVGCCLFKKCCYNFALKWFQKSINSDFTSLLPLWNLASTFHCLGKDDASLETLKHLAQVSSVNSDQHYSPLFCSTLWLEHRPEISHMQALYLIAHRSLLCHHYLLSAEYFTKILNLLKQKPLENLPHSMHFTIYLSNIFIEACYAYLLAGRYEDCLEASNLVSAPDFCFSIKFRKVHKTSFDLNYGRIIWESSHFDCNGKCSVSTASTQDVLPLGHDNMHLSQTGVKQNSLLHLRNENEEPMNSEFSKANTGESIQCSHEHVRSHKVMCIMHMMMEASAKYSLNCNNESYDILNRALGTIMHLLEREETAEGVSFKEKNRSVESFSEGSCTVCSNCITSLNSQVYNNLAVITISRNHIKEAEYCLKLALMSDSGNIDAIYNNSLFQIMLGQVDSAQTFWEASKDGCHELKSILTSDDYCDSTCTVTNASLRSLNEAFSSVT